MPAQCIQLQQHIFVKLLHIIFPLLLFKPFMSLWWIYDYSEIQLREKIGDFFDSWDVLTSSAIYLTKDGLVILYYLSKLLRELEIIHFSMLEIAVSLIRYTS